MSEQGSSGGGVEVNGGFSADELTLADRAKLGRVTSDNVNGAGSQGQRFRAALFVVVLVTLFVLLMTGVFFLWSVVVNSSRSDDFDLSDGSSMKLEDGTSFSDIEVREVSAGVVESGLVLEGYGPTLLKFDDLLRGTFAVDLSVGDINRTNEENFRYGADALRFASLNEEQATDFVTAVDSGGPRSESVVDYVDVAFGDVGVAVFGVEEYGSGVDEIAALRVSSSSGLDEGNAEWTIRFVRLDDIPSLLSDVGTQQVVLGNGFSVLDFRFFNDNATRMRVECVSCTDNDFGLFGVVQRVPELFEGVVTGDAEFVLPLMDVSALSDGLVGNIAPRDGFMRFFLSPGVLHPKGGNDEIVLEVTFS